MMLLPDRNTIDRLLRHYRSQERVVLASPCDLSIRRSFEDTAYTLCVLMGERTAREAVHAAERYVGGAHSAPVGGTHSAPVENAHATPVGGGHAGSRQTLERLPGA
ncbi:DUF5133 domain-containing protein [Streptomyces sp. NPDC090127]|uniref:DUF5133 domain-containing protein n=1 Tax=Streptomyces sp. NPDC090127 TaxID=3365953 RepID=UPI0037F55E72